MLGMDLERTVNRNTNYMSHCEYQNVLYMNVQVAYSKLRFFEEEKVYWTPASTTSALYSQLASKKYREIQRSQIRLVIIIKQAGNELASNHSYIRP